MIPSRLCVGGGEGGSQEKQDDQDFCHKRSVSLLATRLGNLASVDAALGDIDGDGDMDAVTTNLHDLQDNNQPNEIWVNDGKGDFTNCGINMGERSYTVTLADVNNDGKLDIIFDCTIWINNGSLRFTKSTQIFGNGRRLYFEST